VIRRLLLSFLQGGIYEIGRNGSIYKTTKIFHYFLGGVHRARTIIQGKSDKRSGMSWVTFLAQRPDIPIGMFVGFFGLGQLLLEQ